MTDIFKYAIWWIIKIFSKSKVTATFIITRHIHIVYTCIYTKRAFRQGASNKLDILHTTIQISRTVTHFCFSIVSLQTAVRQWYTKKSHAAWTVFYSAYASITVTMESRIVGENQLNIMSALRSESPTSDALESSRTTGGMRCSCGVCGR